MDEKTIVSRNPAMATRTIGEDTILVPILKSSSEIDCIYSLNSSAGRIWQLLDGKRSMGQIKARLVREFDCTVEEAGETLARFVGELEKIKAVKRGKSEEA